MTAPLADAPVMRPGVRSVVRTSWVSVTLAAALGVTMPVAATMAGTALATPTPVPIAVVLGVTETHPGAVHDAAPPQATRATHHRGAHASRRVDGSTPPARDRHTGWDRASVLVHVPAGGLTAHRSPSSASPTVGTVAATSKYYGVPIVIRLDAINAAGTWGRVELPYVWPRRDGWIRLDHLADDQTFIHVDVDLSEHRVRVYKHDELLYSVPGAIGTPSSPTPPGHYVVTDRVPFPAGSALGSFAFGISGIQPHLPVGWSGGNQLAIHGTNDPSSIGTSASAGCVRVSEWALAHFEPLLRLGTPVVIHA